MAAGNPSYTYSFTLDEAGVLFEAFDRVGKRSTELDAYMLASARRSLNLTLIDWATRGVNLWKVQGPTTINLVAGTPTYQTVPNCISVLDAYVSQVNGGGPGVNIDTVLTPMSRTMYSEFPNKLIQGQPTMIWFQKDTPVPQITLYQNPQFGAAQGFTASYYWLSRIMDANATSGETPDVDYLFLEALCADVALALSRKPTIVGQLPGDLKQDLAAHAAEVWKRAAETNREDVPMTILPNLSGYWR